MKINENNEFYYESKLFLHLLIIISIILDFKIISSKGPIISTLKNANVSWLIHLIHVYEFIYINNKVPLLSFL